MARQEYPSPPILHYTAKLMKKQGYFVIFVKFSILHDYRAKLRQKQGIFTPPFW